MRSYDGRAKGAAVAELIETLSGRLYVAYGPGEDAHLRQVTNIEAAREFGYTPMTAEEAAHDAWLRYAAATGVPDEGLRR